MITRLGYDFESKLGLFSIGGAADVENLPTMTENGKEDAELYEPVCPGSYALLNDGSGGKYVLSDADEWVEEV